MGCLRARLCDSRIIEHSLDLVVVRDPEAAAFAAAALLTTVAGSGGSVALAGGSTPRRAYELAAAAHPDWSGVDVWLGDERCVPADDERSNLRLVREALTDRLAAGPRALHAVRTELPPAEAAAEYDAALRDARLDLVLLGLGEDGHTASLFPGAPSLRERSRLAVAAEAGLEPFVPRVTLTVPALASAAQVVFLVVGASKADAARQAFAAPPSDNVPASLVRSQAGATTAILDTAAASLLGNGLCD